MQLQASAWNYLQLLITTNQKSNESALTVKDDDPAISSAGLRVVPEAHVVALHVGRLATAALVHLIATETGVPRLHSGKL